MSTVAPLDVAPARPVLAQSELSFRSIFENEYAYVRLTVQRLGIRDHDRDDVVHDVFLVVHRKLAEFDAARPLRPWLFGIAYRVALGQKRRFGYSRELLAAAESSEHVDAKPRADEELENEERRRMVHEALDHLDDEKRAVFILHELDEIAMPEIATTLGIPANTAYSRLRLARQDFRQALERVVLRAKSARGAVS